MKKTGNKTANMKKRFRTAGTRHGAYSVGMTVLVIAVVIVLNLIVGQIPEAYRNIDVSSTKIYDISDTTTDVLDDLDKDVNMKVLAVKEDADDRIVTFLSKYSGMSDRIKVEWIDPVLHPSALKEYDTSENTIVISCEDTGKTTTVPFSDILVMDQYSYYYYGQTSYTEFDGEGQLTSAVNYVTNETEQKIYQTAGHGEGTLSATITDLMEKSNYQIEDVNLLMTTAVPEDCDLLLMNAPSADLSEDEVKMLEDYLAQGGKVMTLLGKTLMSEMPNLSSLMKDYGMTAADGYMADPARCYQNNPYYIFPELSVSGEMAEGIETQMALLTYAQGMEVTDPVRDTISVSPFMSTSEQSYAVTESAQKEGEYTLGAVATETISGDEEAETKESRFTVITAGSLIDQSITDTFSQLENTQIFMNAVTANFDGVKNLSIEPKSLGVEYNTVQHAGMFSLLMIFGIPAVILITGFTVWFRRRKA